MSGFDLLLKIAGGVALLLWATRMVRTGVLRAYGSQLRRVLGSATKTTLSSFGMGIGMAGILQSSTATALLAVAFAGKGLIAIAPALAVMLGADVGSTLVVQILSLDISWLSPVLILTGFICFTTRPTMTLRHLGRVFIGLGLMLLSLKLVVAASEPMRDSLVLQNILAALSEAPLFAVILAALITWITHSSVAMVLLIMSLSVAGVVTADLALVLVLGANVGAGIVPMALTMSETPTARRIPMGNMLFRFAGVLILLPMMSIITPYVADLSGADAGRQVANFHTIFNIGLAIVFLPLVGVMSRLMERALPEGAGSEDNFKPKYLDESVINTPTVAVACATREVLRLADIVEEMLRKCIDVFETNDPALLQEVSKSDDQVDELHEAIKLYLTQVSISELDEDTSARCVELISFTTNLEHIGDIIDKNLLEIANQKIKKRIEFSEQGWIELVELHRMALDQMQLAMTAFVSGDVDIARQLIADKEKFRDMEQSGGDKHLDRLREGRVESIESSALHIDMIRDLKRINSHLTSVAYPILDASGELHESRLRVRPHSERRSTKAST
ncbi:sodium:phosphate symporter [Kiloniella spongiae]|uniref:Sodium:phosphate symporter n=1 Tax=Kiloniella spongiae TaxID=1489064 RepID=A0A0H2MTW5_9PROT|nr:Na/Pi cotransporter family protein [Kiloniella spongiae]KLN60130.1 sodium:phosphate symporter [Kiloniella spongiae]